MRLTFFLIPLFLLPSFCFAETISLLHYTITPHVNQQEKFFQIDAEFTISEKENIHLILPHEWAGRKDLDKAITNLIVFSENGKKINFAPTEKNNEKIVIKEKDKKIKFSYQVKSSDSHLFEPWLIEDFFSFFGNTLFIVPKIDYNKINTIIIDWKNLPSKWKVANSFGINQSHQELKTSLNNILNASYTGGNLTIYPYEYKNKPIYLSLYSPSSFLSAKENLDKIYDIIAFQRGFIDDTEIPYYLVSIINISAIKNKKFNSLGSNVHQSFTYFIDNVIDIEELILYFSHEHLHYWLGNKIKSSNNYVENMWFFEGLTEYFAYLTALESKLISQEKFLQNYNKMLKAYFLSDFSLISNKELSKIYWDVPLVQNIPYYKGMIFFMEYADKLKKNSHNKNLTMQNFIKKQLQISVCQNKEWDREGLLYLLNTFTPLGSNSAWEWVSYFEKTERIPLSSNLFEKKYELTWQEAEKNDYGFNIKDAFIYHIVHDVQKNSFAEKAGIKNGDIINRISIDTEDPKRPLQIELYSPEKNKETITVFPKKIRKKIPQYTLSKINSIQ